MLGHIAIAIALLFGVWALVWWLIKRTAPGPVL